MSKSQVRASLATLAGACALALGGVTQAATFLPGAVFSDNMEYSLDADVQAVYVRPNGTTSGANGGSSPSSYMNVTAGHPNLVFPPAALAGKTPVPASGKVLRLGNGVRWHDLGTTITGSSGGWTLEAKALQGGFQIGMGLYVLNSDGTQGYGFLWDASSPNNPPGNGHFSIRRFDNSTWQSPDDNLLWSRFGLGSNMSGSNYLHGHPVTGYAVTGGTNDATATFDFLTTWKDMANVKLTWAPNGDLKLYVDGSEVGSAHDNTTFSSFSRLYLRGGGNSYFDNIAISVPEPTMLAPLAIGAAALLRGRKSRA